MSKLFKRMQSLVGDAAEKAETLIETMTEASPEVKTINALAAAFAVLVMADKEATDDEKEAVSEYLIDMDFVIENNLIREVSQLFMKHIDTFEEAKGKDVMEFNICLGEVLRNISVVKEDKSAVDMVAETVTLVTSGGAADPDEIKARNRILKALGR